MSEQSVINTKIKLLYQRLCKDNWEVYTTGIIIAFLSVLIVAWARGWGATGAVTNWAQWILYGIGIEAQKPTSALIVPLSLASALLPGRLFLPASEAILPFESRRSLSW